MTDIQRLRGLPDEAVREHEEEARRPGRPVPPYDARYLADRPEEEVPSPDRLREDDEAAIVEEAARVAGDERSDLDFARDDVAEIADLLAEHAVARKADLADLISEVAALRREIEQLAGQLGQSQGGASANTMASVALRVEIVSEATREAISNADGPLKQVLEKVLGKLGWVGRRLLSTNLHLFPLKEWTLGGEVSAFLVKGTISLTFRAD